MLVYGLEKITECKKQKKLAYFKDYKNSFFYTKKKKEKNIETINFSFV